jgi:hypothetical protein
LSLAAAAVLAGSRFVSVLTGEIPSTAIVEIMTAPSELAEKAGVTFEQLQAKFSVGELAEHGIHPPAPSHTIPGPTPSTPASSASGHDDDDDDGLSQHLQALQRQQAFRRRQNQVNRFSTSRNKGKEKEK